MTKKEFNVLITGASSGIGEALAFYYSGKNRAQNVFICGRNQLRLNKTKTKCEQLGATVHAKILDVTDKAKTQEWIEECEQIASLNLIIANAGVSTIEETPENVFNTFNTNVNGTLNTVVPSIEIFKNRHEIETTIASFRETDKKRSHKQIALLSSIAGYHGISSCPSYSASKACVKAYGEALRTNLLPYKIKINVICPGFIRSRITDKNTCPMPFFMEADKAAKIISKGLRKNKGLISFPMPMRFAAWVVSILPNSISGFISSKLPDKS